jgi:4-aminobutyrate aminotransferase-like enzyme/Ser/Thr protein kinase RdoA (MazF antagonist)
MAPTLAGRPVFPPDRVLEFLAERYGLAGSLHPLPAEWDQNFRLESEDGGQFVVKIANRDEDRSALAMQNAALAHLATSETAPFFPRLVPDRKGSIQEAIDDIFPLRMLTWIEGTRLAEARPLDRLSLRRIGTFLGELDRALGEFKHEELVRPSRWDLAHPEWIASELQHLEDLALRRIVEGFLLQYRARIAPRLVDLPLTPVHNDANDENLLLVPDPAGGWSVAGLLDFGDMRDSHTVNELAIAAAYALFDSDDPARVIADLAAGYHRARPLGEEEQRVLFPLVCMRLCVSVTCSALALREDPRNAHRQISDHPAREALGRLSMIDPRDAEELIRAACGLAPVPRKPTGTRDRELLAGRRRRLSPSLSLAYDEPLEIVRGSGTYLFTPDGGAYLDCVNNVCHVGHCHPRVVAALGEQAALLNTNTRYLHPRIVEFAERLTATLPESLSVCTFVNSGSEANELALRIARAHTGRRDVIVIDGAYHGNTQTLVDLSPYKCEGPGGEGRPDWVHKVAKPDPYRGAHRGGGEEVGAAYAEEVAELCAHLSERGHPPGVFLVEPILGCGGQVELPTGYLRESFAHVRASGGICIADEVQVGMGRVGSHMWAFETQGVVPDIVTIGKPLGNGHPLGAVVTTPEIALSFDNGMEYFCTFGGNPVSMAVGLAVLDVIEEEGLRERAARVGRYLTEGFRRLAERHHAIGDVRGLGLFLGVELVTDRETRAPATKLAARIVERAKSDHVLLSREGPHGNILKIKPPLVFEEVEADLLLGVVDRAMSR